MNKIKACKDCKHHKKERYGFLWMCVRNVCQRRGIPQYHDCISGKVKNTSYLDKMICQDDRRFSIDHTLPSFGKALSHSKPYKTTCGREGQFFELLTTDP